MISRISRGYRFIYLPDHPLANKWGFYQEHRYVMERKIGRLLRPTEVIHHRNGIKDDNRIKNLMLIESENEHAKLEHRLGTYKGKCFTGKEVTQENKDLFRKLYTGKGNPFYGKKHTEETRKKLSALAKLKIGSLNSNYGKKHPGLHKGKKRDKNGKWLSQAIADLLEKN